MLAQTRHHREARQRFQRRRRTRCCGQLGARDQFLVDLLLFGDAQAVRHLDDADAVDEGFVVLVTFEALPFRFVRVRENDAGERDRTDILAADIIAFLRRCEQRVQHLDRRLEHLDEFENALVGTVEAAGIAVRIGIVLRIGLELADIDLADQRGDVLVVLVARLGLGDRDLAQPRRLDLGDAEAGDVAAKRFEPLQTPRAHQAAETAARNAVLLLDHRPELIGIEQAERRFKHRREFVARLEHVDRMNFHQRLQPLGERRLAATDGPEQIEDLLALFETLSCVPEETDDALDRLFHAVKAGEGRIDAHRTVQKNTAKAWVPGRVNHLRLTDRC